MDRRTHDIKPLLLLIFLNVLGIVALIINDNASSYDLATLATAMCMVGLIMYVVITRFQLGDPYLFVIVSMLSSVGIIMLSRLDAAAFGLSHIKMYLAGVGVFFFTLIMYRGFNKFLKSWTLLYYIIAMALLVATLLFGTEINGAKNWIMIGGLSVQPTEFVRIFYVMALAAIMCKAADKDLAKIGKKTNLFNFEKMSEKGKKWIRLLSVAAVAASCAGCLLVQRELGTLLVFGVVYIAFLYVYGESKTFLALNLVAVALAAVVAATAFSHVNERVVAWKDPIGNYESPADNPDSNGKGYQIVHSLIAIGSGDFTGSGIGQGSPTFLFAAESDSIFALICEDMGLMGGIAILMLYFLLVYRGFKISLSTTNPFNKAVCMGLSAVLGIQTFIIVGGITNLIPLTGITLPFISAGGSSMLSTFIVVGILQAISSMKGEATDELE